MRVSTQDDALSSARLSGSELKVVNCLEFAIDTLKAFGFEQYEAELSTWDGKPGGKYLGTTEQWEHAEKALLRATERKSKVIATPDDGFLRPKIDMKLLDAGRRQATHRVVDWNLPAKFELEYVAEDGKRHAPLMVHRALYGSIERFFGGPD